MRYAALLCLLSCVTATAQDLLGITPLESFFRTVVQRSYINEAPPPNTFAPATIQAVLGFTDSEMQSLNAIAKTYLERVSRVRAPSGDLIFQSRLDFAETGKESDTVKQQLKVMAAQLAETLSKATRELRIALGEERYQKFDAWFQAGGTMGCWLAPCSTIPKR